jgi:glycosyltransferase involved in cell wall biosynthesis
MRILLVTQWYWPEPVSLPAEMAESLQSLGHEVTVLTAFPNYPYGKTFSGYRQRPWQVETVNGVRVVRVPIFPDHSRSPIRRALHFASFFFSASTLGFARCRRPDVIHVISPPIPVGFAGWFLGTLFQAPFTLEIWDMWPETLAATGMVHDKRALALVGRLCRWLHRRAAAIRVVSQGFQENLLQKGVSAAKVRVISNWVDTERQRPVHPDLDLGQKLGFDGRFTVMFAGTMGLAQGLDVVMDAAVLLRDLPQVQFALVGDGVDTERLRQRASEEQLDNVRFLGRYPASRMSELYALADVLLVHLRADPLFRITVPQKIFAYLASGKPILAAMEGDVADLVEATRSGLTCSPSDPIALAALVREFVGMPAESRREMGANGRLAACNSYGRLHLVSQVGAMLEEVAQRRSGTGPTAPAIKSAPRRA